MTIPVFYANIQLTNETRFQEVMNAIIISKNGKNEKSVVGISFKHEEELKKYIFKNPDCKKEDRKTRKVALLLGITI